MKTQSEHGIKENIKCTDLLHYNKSFWLVSWLVWFVHENVRIVRRMVLNCAWKSLQVFAETLTMLWNFAYKQQHPPSHTGTKRRRRKNGLNAQPTHYNATTWNVEVCIVVVTGLQYVSMHTCMPLWYGFQFWSTAGGSMLTDNNDVKRPYMALTLNAMISQRLLCVHNTIASRNVTLAYQKQVEVKSNAKPKPNRIRRCVNLIQATHSDTFTVKICGNGTHLYKHKWNACFSIQKKKRLHSLVEFSQDHRQYCENCGEMVFCMCICVVLLLLLPLKQNGTELIWASEQNTDKHIESVCIYTEWMNMHGPQMRMRFG